MGQTYSALSIEGRTQLGLWIQSGLTQCAMASQLGRSASTISREIKQHRSLNGGYLAAAAQQQAQERRKQAKQNVRKLGKAFDTPLGKAVLHELQRALSPEQIAGRLKLVHPDDPTLRVSHETIPLRQNSCRLNRRTLGAAMKDKLGAIRTGNDGQGGGEVAAT